MGSIVAQAKRTVKDHRFPGCDRYARQRLIFCEDRGTIAVFRVDAWHHEMYNTNKESRCNALLSVVRLASKSAACWCEPAPPLPLDRDSKSAAIRALRERGYRVMRSGGEHSVLTITAQELRTSRADTDDVLERERALGYQLPDDAEITKYIITVWPKKQNLVSIPLTPAPRGVGG